MKNSGQFVISLDFELFWGVRDKRALDTYGDAIKSVHEVIPTMLELFREYDVKATFATVGLLFAKNKEEMFFYSPDKKPNYNDANLSPYSDGFNLVGDTPLGDPYHYAFDLLQLIRNQYPEHEIATHTYSHYYCQEEGQTIEDFDADMASAVAIAKDKGIEISSLVFPRNQYNQEYLEVCKKNGIQSYRGNESTWFHAAESEGNTSMKKRIYRTLDCYVNISGHHVYNVKNIAQTTPYNITSSRFLRPFNTKGGKLLEYLKLHRIKKSMTYAAKKGLLYHLWWHPHNFGRNTAQNFKTLKSILEHYQYLNKTYGYESNTMSKVIDED